MMSMAVSTAAGKVSRAPWWALALVSAVLLVACGRTEVHRAAGGDGGSVGTFGGGGTLVFTFKSAALQAADAMETVDITAGGVAREAALVQFYVRHRAAWLAALRRFVTEPDIVVETGRMLVEEGRQVAAHVEPIEAPTRVLLSFPTVNVGDGFTTRKAIGLAIHEAGHFAVPAMSPREHGYLDAIATLLTAGLDRGRRSPSLLRLDVPPGLSELSGFSLSRDAAKLTFFGPMQPRGEGKTAFTQDLVTREIFAHGSFERAIVVDQDRLLFVTGDFGILWNQRTNQRERIECRGVERAWNHPGTKDLVLLGRDASGFLELTHRGARVRKLRIPEVAYVNEIEYRRGFERSTGLHFSGNGRYAVTEGRTGVFEGNSVLAVANLERPTLAELLVPRSFVRLIDFDTIAGLSDSHLLALQSKDSVLVADVGTFARYSTVGPVSGIEVRRFPQARFVTFDDERGRVVLLGNRHVVAADLTTGDGRVEYGPFVSPHYAWRVPGTAKLIVRESTEKQTQTPVVWTGTGTLRVIDLAASPAAAPTERRSHALRLHQPRTTGDPRRDDAEAIPAQTQAVETPHGAGLVSSDMVNQVEIRFLEQP